jgi:hypothetical protein
MANKTTRIKSLSFLVVLIGLVILGQALHKRCSERAGFLNIDTPISVDNLYPWPGAKIPFACHILVFLKSPFAPRGLPLHEMVYKENGFYMLKECHRREGVVTADISIAGDLFPIFDEPMRYGKMPLFADSTSLHVDGKKLKIGHIGWREFDLEFRFATILNPFLLPGEHLAKIVVLLPSGKTVEYEWKFEITWW